MSDEREEGHGTQDVLFFFETMPQAYPLYKAFEDQIVSAFEDVRIRVQKTQITFANQHNFACVSLPGRFRKKIGIGPAIVVTFGLVSRLNAPRIELAVEPYPNRWTHHVLVRDAAELDDELMGWIKEAYAVSAMKR